MEEIRLLQDKLDTKKYYQSEIARQDLSGLMEYCEDCTFRQINLETNKNTCILDHSARVANHICAKNYMRRKNDEDRTKTKTNTRRKNNG